MPSFPPKPAPATDTSALAALVVNSNLIALALTDRDRVQFANAAFRRLFGLTAQPADLPIADLLVPEYRAPIRAALQAPDGPPAACVAKAFRGAAATFDVELRFEPLMHDGRPLLALLAEDVTEQYRAAAPLNPLAFADPLTGLDNRAMFADRLRHAALTTRRVGQGFAVVMLDLDHFRSINDRHGRDAGDLVLQRIASRLQAHLRQVDTVARLGGDAFAVLLSSISARADANTVAQRLINVASRPIDLGLTEVEVGASAGVAIYPEDALTVDHLLAAADAALYAAKRGGRGCVVCASAASPAEIAPAPLIWNVAHEVGVREIDEQHATLAGLLNELSVALRNGQEHAAIYQEIVRYAGFHFAAEERLMRSCDYDEEAAHRDMHRRLLDDLCGLRLEECEVAGVSLTLRYLQEWLLRHVDGADRDLAAALRAAGVA